MSRAEDIFQKLVYFGEDAIDEYIVNMQTEELFLDFKQAISIGKNGTTLHKDDRKNLAKCISGFGNSEGGVVIWGVECSRDMEIGDVAKAKVKVKNVHRFLSWLENAISGCTIPSHNKVRNHIISADENGDRCISDSQKRNQHSQKRNRTADVHRGKQHLYPLRFKQRAGPLFGDCRNVRAAAAA